MRTFLIGLLATTWVWAGCKDGEKPAAERATTGDSPTEIAEPGSTAVPPTAVEPSPHLQAAAAKLAKRFIIVDGHVDLPYRLNELGKEQAKVDRKVDLGAVAAGTEEGDFDYPRAAKGGLDAPFMSIYVPAKLQAEGGAKALADQLIDMVEGIVRASPDKFALARSPAEVRANFAAGTISLPMGIENGAAIESNLANLAHFHGRGVRYMTLTHSEDNAICDSSYAETHKWKGLSPFGVEVVAEMNRLGIMIDISHVSDDAFHQVIERSKTPVIASHSSTRRFVPGFERDMADDMIRKLAANGGVMMINFGSGFVKKESNEHSTARWKAIREFADASGLEREHPKVEAFAEEYTKKHPFPYADLRDVVDHIDHVVKLVGVDHVGFGSDFDGVGDSLPTGLKDVSMYPNLIAELLARGYSEADIEKICSGNVLRVWQAVEDYAAKQR